MHSFAVMEPKADGFRNYVRTKKRNFAGGAAGG